MTKIKNDLSLPEKAPWFNKEKYSKAPSLHISQWYEQLLIRKLVSIFLEHPNVPNAALKSAITHLRNKPITDLAKDKELSIFKPYLDSMNPTYLEGVHPITLQNFLQIEMSLPKEKTDFTRKWLNSNHLNIDLLSDPRAPFITELISNLVPETRKEQELLSINLKLPSAVLTKQFKAYVTQKKKTLKIKSKIRYQTLDTYLWHRTGILPYLDIITWQKETRVSITNEQLLDAITPSGEETDINSLRTTRKLAAMLLTDVFLEELATLAHTK